MLSVNGRDLSGSSLSQALKWIRETDKFMTAVVEYDVAVVDRSPFAHSPLLVELAVKPASSAASLGIHLAAPSGTQNERRVIIESIVPGSIAER